MKWTLWRDAWIAAGPTPAARANFPRPAFYSVDQAFAMIYFAYSPRLKATGLYVGVAIRLHCTRDASGALAGASGYYAVKAA